MYKSLFHFNCKNKSNENEAITVVAINRQCIHHVHTFHLFLNIKQCIELIFTQLDRAGSAASVLCGRLGHGENVHVHVFQAKK